MKFHRDEKHGKHSSLDIKPATSFSGQRKRLLAVVSTDKWVRMNRSQLSVLYEIQKTLTPRKPNLLQLGYIKKQMR